MATASKKTEARLKAIHKQNFRCFNCEHLGTSYIIPGVWVFVCADCSGRHMGNGQRVKSVTMAKFTDEEVAALEAGGNKAAEQTFLAGWDGHGDTSRPTDRNPRKVDAWIKAVFLDKRYYSESKARQSNERATADVNCPTKSTTEVMGTSVKLQVHPVGASAGPPAVPSSRDPFFQSIPRPAGQVPQQGAVWVPTAGLPAQPRAAHNSSDVFDPFSAGAAPSQPAPPVAPTPVSAAAPALTLPQTPIGSMLASLSPVGMVSFHGITTWTPSAQSSTGGSSSVEPALPSPGAVQTSTSPFNNPATGNHAVAGNSATGISAGGFSHGVAHGGVHGMPGQIPHQVAPAQLASANTSDWTDFTEAEPYPLGQGGPGTANVPPQLPPVAQQAAFSLAGDPFAKEYAALNDSFSNFSAQGSPAFAAPAQLLSNSMQSLSSLVDTPSLPNHSMRKPAAAGPSPFGQAIPGVASSYSVLGSAPGISSPAELSPNSFSSFTGAPGSSSILGAAAGGDALSALGPGTQAQVPKPSPVGPGGSGSGASSASAVVSGQEFGWASFGDDGFTRVAVATASPTPTAAALAPVVSSRGHGAATTTTTPMAVPGPSFGAAGGPTSAPIPLPGPDQSAAPSVSKAGAHNNQPPGTESTAQSASRGALPLDLFCEPAVPVVMPATVTQPQQQSQYQQQWQSQPKQQPQPQPQLQPQQEQQQPQQQQRWQLQQQQHQLQQQLQQQQWQSQPQQQPQQEWQLQQQQQNPPQVKWQHQTYQEQQKQPQQQPWQQQHQSKQQPKQQEWLHQPYQQMQQPTQPLVQQPDTAGQHTTDPFADFSELHAALQPGPPLERAPQSGGHQVAAASVQPFGNHFANPFL